MQGRVLSRLRPELLSDLQKKQFIVERVVLVMIRHGKIQDVKVLLLKASTRSPALLIKCLLVQPSCNNRHLIGLLWWQLGCRAIGCLQPVR